MKLLLQKMKQIAKLLSIVIVCLLLNNFAGAQEKFILSTTEFTIKAGHERQFEEGVKEWKTCYLENNGEWNWTMWKRFNGEGSVYVLSSRLVNWAELDDDNDEAGKKCWQIALDKIIPHVESRVNNYSNNMPDISKTSPAEMGAIWVTFFKVKNSTVFMDLIKEISGLIEKSEGDERGYWYNTAGGGPESANYFVTTPFKNFAAMDIERDGVWKIVENAKGNEVTEVMRESFRNSVESMWGYMYKRMDNLSHFPAQ